MYLKTLTVFACFTTIFSAESPSSCVTPLGENAKCIPINSCKVIRDALKYLEKEAVEFAKRSHCGHVNDSPLVCCGSAGSFPNSRPEKPIHVSTLPPPPSDLVVTPIDNLNLPDQSLCGIQSKGDRITGESTAVDEYPWTVALKYAKEDDPSSLSFRCAGTLINQRYVITAAQCLNIPGYKLIEARLGEWKFSNEKDCDDDTQEETCANPILIVPVMKTLRHPYYDNQTGSNNIGLVLLESKIKYSAYIRPICLPPSDLPLPAKGSSLVISGWGITGNEILSQVKLQKTLFVNSENCSSNLPEAVRKATTQFCTDVDDYYGDVGGPLMKKYFKSADAEDEQWYLEGIVIKLPQLDQKNTPILYTRLSKYTSWVLNSLDYP